uniref:Ig-like domain-containing protein n=1 Tax=Mastacembelus armatus TaxID=205130 RepID=A0A3Q3MQF3_9TELE
KSHKKLEDICGFCKQLLVRAHLEGKSSLLCLASDMFPPLVRFSWKRQKENGQLEELPSDEREQLELREPGRTAAILLVHQPENSTYKYRCYVEHEGGRHQTHNNLCLFQSFSVAVVPLDPLDPVQSECRVKLLCLLYTVLIVKSLLYCCGLSLLMSLRNKGPSTCCSHAD